MEKKLLFKKSEKKLNQFYNFSKNKNNLLVADNISKYYAIDLNSWKFNLVKKNDYPFNSQIKIYKEKFFIVDYKNILRCFSLKDGKEIWNLKQKIFIKSQKKLFNCN